MATPPLPDTTTPLVTQPDPPSIGSTITDGLGQLARLVGTWHNTDDSFSWNVMPLPQDNVEDYFILKNFGYTEEITFAQIPGTAPNRGSGFTQVANTLFYEQRVYFGKTSAPFTVPDSSINTLVHAENGSWLFLDIRNQFSGAFPKSGSAPVPLPDGVTTLPKQNPAISIAKQMSVPHGNSILAVGQVNPPAKFPPPADPVVAPDNPGTPTLTTIKGSPSIPQVNTIPTYKGKPYGSSKYQPSTKNANGVESNSNINPNIKLVDYLAKNPATEYVHFKVSAPGSEITNITFETGHSLVNSYTMEIWLINPGTADEALLYYQNIGMAMTLSPSSEKESLKITFPHITANVIKRVS